MAYNSKSSLELEYIFIGMKFVVEFQEDGEFLDEETKEIRDFVSKMSKVICIDKSYVECNENKRKSTFMLENGWNALKDVVLDTDYCRHMSDHANAVVIDAFVTMSRCYMYECLANITDKFSQVNIFVDGSCEFEVIVCKDIALDYKNYSGRWQDWEFDNDGKFLSSHISPNI